AHQALSAADGSFTIDSLRGETWLVARHEKLLPAVRHVHGDGVEPIRLVLDQGGAVRLERLDADDRPVAGENVRLMMIGLDAEPTFGWVPSQLRDFLPYRTAEAFLERKTGEDGAALFEDLTPGDRK